MTALLAGIGPGDEVIAPSFTFVSTVNAFILRGAKIVFADSSPTHPNMDVDAVEALITPRTRAIVAVHYAGTACSPLRLAEIALRHRLCFIEDAAQAIDASHDGRPLGSFGAMSAFSFHETKNVNCGEGGLLVVNDPALRARAEIIWEKGTNRAAFYRGEVDKYGWVDVGSSFLPSDITAAVLLAQLENIRLLQDQRMSLWTRYQTGLAPLAASGRLGLPMIPVGAIHNAHLYFVVCRSLEERTALQGALRAKGIETVFHYQSLHRSAYYTSRHDGRSLPQSDRYSDCLLRLPLFHELAPAQVDEVCEAVHYFCAK
jgi:dTDP-4-amino-4,6-dideoxygalactose transaminase